jgi:amino acid transporter
MTASYQPPPPRSPRTIAWSIGRGLVWLVYAFAIAAIVIATIAFFLQLFGANPSAGFAQWIYRSAARVTAPFRGIFPSHAVTNDAYLDVSLLFAIIMYAIFALLVSEGVGWLERKRDASVRRDLYEEQEAEARRLEAEARAAQAQAATAAANGRPERSRTRQR